MFKQFLTLPLVTFCIGSVSDPTPCPKEPPSFAQPYLGGNVWTLRNTPPWVSKLDLNTKERWTWLLVANHCIGIEQDPEQITIYTVNNKKPPELGGSDLRIVFVDSWSLEVVEDSQPPDCHPDKPKSDTYD